MPIAAVVIRRELRTERTSHWRRVAEVAVPAIGLLFLLVAAWRAV